MPDQNNKKNGTTTEEAAIPSSLDAMLPPSFADTGAPKASVDDVVLPDVMPPPVPSRAVAGDLAAKPKPQISVSVTSETVYKPRDIPRPAKPQPESDMVVPLELNEEDIDNSFADLPNLIFDDTPFDEPSPAGKTAPSELDLEEDSAYHQRFYERVLRTLAEASDLGIDGMAKARIAELERTNLLPQLIIRQVMASKLVDRKHLARAMARTQGRLEILTYQDIPAAAHELRKDLDPRAQMIMRDRRVIPLRRRVGENGEHELHMAHEEATHDLVFESSLHDFLHNYKFVWHYAAREVCGQYWVTGDEGGAAVEEGLEAEALLDRIISDAIDARASDIHVDPNIKGEPKAVIKYRVDGFVRAKETITIEQLDRLRIRIENIARMPKVDLNHPNKGAFSREGFDWRVQIQPHAGRQGPVARMVIRRLQPDTMPMEKLGYPQDFTDRLIKAAKSPNGVIFWTGPTGSGKTESIHSAVVTANPMGRGLSVHTIEDPPEKRVDGYAVQMEIAEGDKARTGLELMKSSLRADPDVIIVGEVRAPDMAKLVFDAANTGHLVFSTLHTNSAIDAIVRLDELGISGFLVSYIRGIAAQRLLRRLCKHCRKPMAQPDMLTQRILDHYGMKADSATLFSASDKGCVNCNYTGYSGRVAAAEWLEPNHEILVACAKHEYTDLEFIAKRAGWKPMGYMAAQHMCHGITDAAELQAVILELAAL